LAASTATSAGPARSTGTTACRSAAATGRRTESPYTTTALERHLQTTIFFFINLGQVANRSFALNTDRRIFLRL
jgi:hypothetical protein